MSIAIQFIRFAADEGKINAVAELEDIRDALESILDVGSPDEIKAASFLIGNVNEAISQIQDGALVKIARTHE